MKHGEKYPITVRSPSDPRGELGGLGFLTMDEALDHQSVMNNLREVYDLNHPLWDKNFWKTKPEKWEIYEN